MTCRLSVPAKAPFCLDFKIVLVRYLETNTGILDLTIKNMIEVVQMRFLRGSKEVALRYSQVRTQENYFRLRK